MASKVSNSLSLLNTKLTIILCFLTYKFPINSKNFMLSLAQVYTFLLLYQNNVVKIHRIIKFSLNR